MPTKRTEGLHFARQIWGATDGIESRLRELTDEVKALRLAMQDERASVPKERRLPRRIEDIPDPPDTPTPRRR